MISKRIAFVAVAIVLTAGVAAGIAQPPPQGSDDDWGLAPAAVFAVDDGAGGFAGPGGPGPGRPRLAAFRGPGRPGRPGAIGPGRLADYLQLTDSQRESARTLFAAQREKLRPLVEQQRKLGGELREMLDDANASDAAVGQLVKELRANRQTMKTARQGLHDQLASLLDANQKAKLEQLRSVMEGLRDSSRHRGRSRS